MTTSEAQQIVKRMTSLLPHVKAGALRIWGEWFGRPYDNLHTIIGCQADKELLQIVFSEGETLIVWNPRGFQIGQETFRIDVAERVR